jgi:hypothetical protein
MGRSPQETSQIEHRRQQVAQYYLQGWSQGEIARNLGIAQSTVSSDLKAIRRAWRESAVRDFDEAVCCELARLSHLEREAWTGWRRSLDAQETTRIVQAEGAKRAEKTVRQSPGDPRFLDLVHRCIAGRRAILGLDAPTRIAPTSPDGTQSYTAHDLQELLEMVENPRRSPLVIDAQVLGDMIDQASAPLSEDNQ